MTDEPAGYQAVNKALMERFKSFAEPQEIIHLAVASRLENNYLVRSLNEMDCPFEKAGFNNEAGLGLLRNAIMAHTDVSQFVLYRAPTTSEGLKKAVRDFVPGRKAFLAAHMARQTQPLTSKQILQRPGKRQESDQI